MNDDIRGHLKQAPSDTGASGISICRATATRLGLGIEPEARYIEVGVGGEEELGVSEPASLGLAGYHIDDPEDPCQFLALELGRFEIVQGATGFTLELQDVIGMPALQEKVVVLDTGRLTGSRQVATQVLPSDDPNLPPCDFTLKLRMQKFDNPHDKRS